MNLFKLLVLILPLFIAACSSNNSNDAPTAEQEAKPVTFTGTGTLDIAPVIFTKDLKVRSAIRNECQLLTKLPGFIQSYGQDQYAAINLDAKRSSKTDYLKIEIIEVSQHKKNIWVGRSGMYGGRGGQWVTVKGSLIRKGKKTVSFEASRSSSGGFMGGYKGTCALLGRCTKALGKDIAEWLKNPVDDATLGEM